MKGILLNAHELSYAITKLEEELASRAPRRYLWGSKDGTRRYLADMTEEHLVNTIKYLRRKDGRAGYSDIDSLGTY